LERTWSAWVMHARYWPGVEARLVPGGLVVYNRSVTGELTSAVAGSLVGVDAGEIAAGLGAPMAAGFVLLGAYAAATGLVGVDSLVGAMKELVPPYRAQHVAVNEAALRAGAAAPVGDRSAPSAVGSA
jgi:Pyruvate/2-oxoacid:ferredoxin oxidoreductase gamma subunit